MMYSDTGSLNLLRFPADNGNDTKLDKLIDEDEDKKDSQDKFIVCRQCLYVITRTSERIEKNGSHRHTFANPHGIIFEIGCFRFAEGCGYAGPFLDDFSWFNGFYWKVAVCARCLSHLGWLFKSTGNEVFHGLIVDKLIFKEE